MLLHLNTVGVFARSPLLLMMDLKFFLGIYTSTMLTVPRVIDQNNPRQSLGLFWSMTLGLFSYSAKQHKNKNIQSQSVKPRVIDQIILGFASDDLINDTRFIITNWFTTSALLLILMTVFSVYFHLIKLVKLKHLNGSRNEWIDEFVKWWIFMMEELETMDAFIWNLDFME